MRIESHQNPRIKELQKLTKRRRRDFQKVTIVEGVREMQRALTSGILPVEVYICKEVIEESQLSEEQDIRVAISRILEQLNKLDASRGCQLFDVPPALFEKIAYRGTTGGLLGVVPYLPLSLDKFSPAEDSFYIVVENVEKPGNLGAILRTADAAGVDGIIVTYSEDNTPTDIHNPNTIRASLGTIFSVPIAQTTTANAIRWLQEQKAAIVTTSPASKSIYTQADFSHSVAIVMGSEARGVSQSWLDAADVLVSIPMHGIADSLNLATSTAIVLYEVVRQRGTDG